jgi:ribulose-phosphate 3-epimerase
MIEAPERQIEEFAKAGADSITFHAEATAARQPHARRDPRARLPRRDRDQPGTPVEAVAELRGSPTSSSA